MAGQQGKTIAGPNGKRIFFPAGTSDEDIAAAFGGGESAPAPAPAPAPASAPAQPSLWQKAKDNFNANTQHVPTTGLKSVVQNIGAGGADVLREGKHMVDGTPVHKWGLNDILAKGESDINDPIAATASTVGQVGTGALLGAGAHAAAPAVADVAATGLNKTAGVLEGTGRLASRLAVGAPAPVDNLGADVGGALSENHIVGASRRSLGRKVEARIAPASEARDAILSRNQSAPVDVTPDVQQPYDAIANVKTDPQTGAVRPGAMRQADTVRRAILHQQEPDGTITQQPKDLNLNAAQMGKLQQNVYAMADYSSSESDVANTYTKKVGSALKDRINAVAPEASTMTDSLHDLLGARDHLQSTQGGHTAATDFSPGKLAGKAYDAARTGGLTAAGAGLDMAGGAVRTAAGALRRAVSASASPVAPISASTPKGLPADVPANGESGQWELPSPSPTPRSANPVTTPAPASLPRLPASASPDSAPQLPPVGQLHPGQPNLSTARTRISPTAFAPDAAPAPRRPLVAAPDGTVMPKPAELPAPRQPLQLEAATGRAAPSQRPSLLTRFKQQAENNAQGMRMRDGKPIAASRRKLAAVPEASQPPAEPDFQKLAEAKTSAATPEPDPVAAPPPHLPASHDVDGWEALVDKGQARYNTGSHQYDYTGPVRRRSLTGNAPDSGLGTRLTQQSLRDSAASRVSLHIPERELHISPDLENRVGESALTNAVRENWDIFKKKSRLAYDAARGKQ